MLIHEACDAGARKHYACDTLALSVRTVERWEKENGYHDKQTCSS